MTKRLDPDVKALGGAIRALWDLGREFYGTNAAENLRTGLLVLCGGSERVESSVESDAPSAGCSDTNAGRATADAPPAIAAGLQALRGTP